MDSYPIKRISMWSGPRNVSTAFMYAFHHRGDCEVIDEPYYAYYLKHTGIEHPMREEILSVQENTAAKVTERLCKGSTEKPYLFMKNMPHHMVDVDLDFAQEFQNFFLIREPRAMIASYLQKRGNVTMKDLGLDTQYELFESLSKFGKKVPVIDSRTLLNNPRDVLTKLCFHLDIPFKESMLEWPAGAVAKDGIWAEHWYANVHRSTGFGAAKNESEVLIPRHLEGLASLCDDYYEALKKMEIR
jgi:hypothetical protein